MQKDFLTEEAFHQGTVFAPNYPVVRVEDRLATACPILAILLPGMTRLWQVEGCDVLHNRWALSEFMRSTADIACRPCQRPSYWS
jgi:hypothetical protein